jgi:limonene-1,2-epoxide hydrolase
LIGYAMQMAAEKAKNPGDDIVTQLVEADLDGEKLSDDEFGWFVLMLAVAGNETTRNSITQGMMAFTEHPDQWDLFKRERPEIAADEIVRWATPVTSFQRTAVEDTELSGVQIRKGQRVVMFYRSANFDEEVFEDPFTFNILRNPNPHVGFGGHGAHYCIGANLAKMTLNLMFGAVADHMPDLAPNSSPDRLRSGWLNGIKHWQVDYSGASRRKKMMSDNDQLIREFCALWSASKIEEIIDFFAEDAVYHNIPMDPAVGKEAIGTTIRGFFAALRGIDFVIHKQVAAGNLVMNERTDTFHGDGFSVPLPIMGVFEISEGKIKAWRDYFDLSTMMNAMAGATT